MTSPTKRPTVSRDRWERAQAAWRAGEPWSPEWKAWRHMAAIEAGIVEAPEGSQWDEWTDEHPSQRAILVRAMRESPGLLRSAIRSPRVHSWAAVIAIVVRGWDERIADSRPQPVGGSPERDAAALRDIIRRLAT